MRTGHKDEEDAECDSSDYEHQERHCGSGHEQTLDERFPHSRPVHPCVFAEADVRGEDVELVLVRHQEVAT